MDRGASPDGDTVNYYASCLAGFSRDAIDAACAELGREEVDKYRPWPDRQRIEALCRKHQPTASTEWTLARYREAWYLDRYIDEQMAFNGLTREEAVGKLDAASRAMWSAWKNQTLAGTIQVPALWHEECRGMGLIPVWSRSPNPEVTTPVCMRHRPCECRKGAAE